MSGYPLLSDAIRTTQHLTGEVWECGVFEGDTSLIIKNYLEDINSPKIFRLFDTFEGMPYSGLHDVHEIGSMKADVDIVRKKLLDAQGHESPNIRIHKGIMPASFDGLGDTKISIAFIDVDNYESVKGCIEFIYPRVEEGGWIIIDDYYCTQCPGAKLAIDNFLKDKKEHIFFDDDFRNPQVFFVKGWLKKAEKNYLTSIQGF
jgi:O-methyltransferase